MTVFRAILGILLAALLSAPVMAQELLANRSFEAPVVPADGNNFYTSIAGWSITNVSPPRPDAWNIIRPWSGYGGNPTVTPTDGGIQYADVNGASGTLFQSVTLPSNGMVDLSAWFSVRDFPQALS